MKKIYALNGSPRSNGNTALILKKALEGAASAGAEVEFIDLIKLNFSGCKSCFECKRKGSKNFGKCALKDDFAIVLEKLQQADGIIMGSPVYFGGETGLYRNALERLFFPVLRYTAPPGSAAGKKVNFAFVYTMNIPESAITEYGYKETLEKTLKFPELVFKSDPAEVLYVCDTYQFSDYSLYESSLFDPEHKKLMRDQQFPLDLAKAFAMGRRLAEKA